MFINASEHFEKGKKQNTLSDAHFEKIIDTYKYRNEIPRYSRRVALQEIEQQGYNLNISRYVNTSVEEEKIDLKEVNLKLVAINEKIKEATDKHNEFLKELGLPQI
ncbi:N-6 DNA methylase [Flavobacterium croceum DSM 17960]|uniref:site-specific DNA-methyltransferase (adenine-specific) n=1 Tax=Flavobacterium croceum DSM 17960 TaxID=1121886 RepID=A0A2S4N9B9_9FLAO|nr:N-6 DNA methylase [Flavobacterium croceum DSM 17960]